MIFLDNQTSPMLKTLLKKEIEAHPLNFIASRLLKMVEEDEARKEKIKTCEHTYQPLYGFHERCKGCGGIKDGYETWVCEELKNTLT